MRTDITALRSDLIELRLKHLGGTGATLLEQARSLHGTLGPACLRRIRAVATMRDRWARQSGTKRVDRIDLALFLEDCDVVERQLAGLLRQGVRSSPAPAAAA